MGAGGRGLLVIRLRGEWGWGIITHLCWPRLPPGARCVCVCVLALHIKAPNPAALQNKSSLKPKVKVKLHPNQICIVLKEQATKLLPTL